MGVQIRGGDGKTYGGTAFAEAHQYLNTERIKQPFVRSNVLLCLLTRDTNFPDPMLLPWILYVYEI